MSEFLDYHVNRWQALDSDFKDGWQSHLRELQRWFNPRRGQFFLPTNTNKPKRRNQFLNETAIFARRALAGGMYSFGSNPARPWIKLDTFGPAQDHPSNLQEWLANGERFAMDVFQRSNLYTSYYQAYDELGWAGTGPILFEQDFNTIVRSYQLTAGSWRIALNSKLQVDTLYFENPWTFRQMVDAFGKNNVSRRVRDGVERHGEEIVTVICAIEPNVGRFAGEAGKLFPWRLVYFEQDNPDGGEGKPLAVEGRVLKPFVAPRWNKLAREAMGYSPAMEVIGSVEGLDIMERDRRRIVAAVADPAMLKPQSVREDKFAPRSTVTVDPSVVDKIRPAYELTLAGYDQLVQEGQLTEERIRHAMYTDLFMLMYSLRDKSMTAYETSERASERMMSLGSVLEGLDNELFDETVMWILNTAINGRVLAPPPVPTGSTQEVKVVYDSVLHQAQRAVGIGNLDRFIAVIGTSAALKPEAVDKLDVDGFIDEYAERLRVSPHAINAQDEVEPIRATRQRREAQIAAAQEAEQMANTVQKLGNTPTGQNSALDQVLESIGAPTR